ncbi:MAG: Gfo/Idh/MocA family oxidoreductase, partial [Clostridia bacterium]|nr:Gfo/Idh/MocA family oxidoreductase [Clostridia bacterium]
MSTQKQSKVRLGIIGVGNMGSGHIANILAGRCPEIEVTAVADINPARLDYARSKIPEVAVFNTAEEMLDSGLIDAAIVAVPHYFHPKYVLECFKRGIHV